MQSEAKAELYISEKTAYKERNIIPIVKHGGRVADVLGGVRLHEALELCMKWKEEWM